MWLILLTVCTIPVKSFSAINILFILATRFKTRIASSTLPWDINHLGDSNAVLQISICAYIHALFHYPIRQTYCVQVVSKESRLKKFQKQKMSSIMFSDEDFFEILHATGMPYRWWNRVFNYIHTNINWKHKHILKNRVSVRTISRWQQNCMTLNHHHSQ